MPIEPDGAEVVDERLSLTITPSRLRPEGPAAVDIALVYCADVEEDAARSFFNDGEARPYRPSMRRFYTSTKSGADDRKYSLVAGQASDQGGLDMSGLLRDLHLHFAPRIICLVGIAGALDPDLALGTVLVASQVIWYERGKDTDDGTLRELRPFELPQTTRNLLNGVMSDFRASPDAPSVVWGVYGTGEKVVAGELSSVRTWLKTVNRKCDAVEMESGGFFHCFGDPSFEGHGKIHLVVKGISDHADPNKTDRDQPRAAMASLWAAFRLACAVLFQEDKAT